MAGNRKRQKQKRHSCALCKPYKMGWDHRWKAREADALERWERQRRDWLGRTSGSRDTASSWDGA